MWDFSYSQERITDTFQGKAEYGKLHLGWFGLIWLQVALPVLMNGNMSNTKYQISQNHVNLPLDGIRGIVRYSLERVIPIISSIRNLKIRRKKVFFPIYPPTFTTRSAQLRNSIGSDIFCTREKLTYLCFESLGTKVCLII